MNVIWYKAIRCMRRVPKTWWRAFWGTLWNPGQLLTALVSWIGIYLILENASKSERAAQFSQWKIGVEAFLIAVAVWAFLSLFAAPFVAIRDDRKIGEWRGTRRIYNTPLLVATERFEALDGATQRRVVEFADAEPGSFAYFSVDATPNVQGRVLMAMDCGAHLTGYEIVPPIIPGQFIRAHGTQGHFGIRLNGRMQATLAVRVEPETVPIILRIYCHEFYVGPDGSL